MNNVEAKFILQGYRPNGADAGDATFCAALEQSRLDPALGAWFAQEQAFDRAVCGKLQQVQVPAGLREAILAGGKVTERREPRRAWWGHPALLAMAASVALLLGVGVAFWPKQAVAADGLAEFALNDTLHERAHGGHGKETGALQTMLSQPTTRLGERLSVNFAALRAAGCRTVSFNGREVLEVCFQRDGMWFHCYIARRADFPSLVAAVAPALADRKGAGLASWADSSLVYVVVSKAGRSALEKLL